MKQSWIFILSSLLSNFFNHPSSGSTECWIIGYFYLLSYECILNTVFLFSKWVYLFIFLFLFLSKMCSEVLRTFYYSINLSVFLQNPQGSHSPVASRHSKNSIWIDIWCTKLRKLDRSGKIAFTLFHIFCSKKYVHKY